MSVGCDRCGDDPWVVYFHGDEMAFDAVAHTSLYRCDSCGTWYDVAPEGRQAPEPVSEDEARRRYPDWFG